MPKYWREIAIEAQEQGARYYAAAVEAREAGSLRVWAIGMHLAAQAYARARWAAAAPDDCP